MINVRKQKKLIHAFRNAADTHSHACFDMPRWLELRRKKVRVITKKEKRI
ncbi:hypothetical protein BvCmsNSNP013_02491 [Escherichia coli]|nr:hypothetical protein BvCmsNSNP013_02491 [Escherichia coli]